MVSEDPGVAKTRIHSPSSATASGSLAPQVSPDEVHQVVDVLTAEYGVLMSALNAAWSASHQPLSGSAIRGRSCLRVRGSRRNGARHISCACLGGLLDRVVLGRRDVHSTCAGAEGVDDLPHRDEPHSVFLPAERTREPPNTWCCRCTTTRRLFIAASVLV